MSRCTQHLVTKKGGFTGTVGSNIQYISDIHLELLFKNSVKVLTHYLQPKDNAKILVLAGDIGNPYTKDYQHFIQDMSRRFPKVFVIAGNHEYYNNRVAETKRKIREVCDSINTTNSNTNVSFLDNSWEDYEGERFIGTTLWSHISKPQYTINDTKQIKDFDVEAYNALHAESKTFLEGAFASCKTDNIKANVITHHLPFYELTKTRMNATRSLELVVEGFQPSDHAEYKGSFYTNYSQWFNARLDGMIFENKEVISRWFYGHTHKRSVQRHYDIDFYCNPLGYSGENGEIDETINQCIL